MHRLYNFLGLVPVSQQHVQLKQTRVGERVEGHTRLLHVPKYCHRLRHIPRGRKDLQQQVVGADVGSYILGSLHLFIYPRHPFHISVRSHHLDESVEGPFVGLHAVFSHPTQKLSYSIEFFSSKTKIDEDVEGLHQRHYLDVPFRDPIEDRKA